MSHHTEGLCRIDGVDCYRILDTHLMEPFLLTVVSPEEHWMYISSRGGLSAGRVNAQHCLFPYRTDDLLHAVDAFSGPWTGIRVGEELWEPFTGRAGAQERRHLAKSVLGDRIVFESHHEGLGLVARAWWTFSNEHGFVRTVSLEAAGEHASEVQVLDALRDLQVGGASLPVMQSMSCLVNAYTRSECVGSTSVATFAMETALSDRAEPAESLRATTVFAVGNGSSTLDPLAVESFVRRGAPKSMRRATGRAGQFAYAVEGEVGQGQTLTWALVADVHRTQTEVSALADRAEGIALSQLRAEADAATEAMGDLLAQTDGHQCSGDSVLDIHHASNTLFNNMRGGIPVEAERVPWGDFVAFLGQRNQKVAQKHAAWLESRSFDDWCTRTELLSEAKSEGDLQLLRLTYEYLPFWFGRRHGDPSRPWNVFNIRVRHDDGSRRLAYEGNWRDIFQNWEALGLSHPGWVDHFILKFVNATTLDGFNPYRITREGVDWEVPEADNPWSNIGYWGDHQITYLSRLLELSASINPERMREWMSVPMFSFADVPYTLKSHQELVADPRQSIVFDWEQHESSEDRRQKIGSDGRLVHDGDDLLQVTFLEKLLIPVLSKMSTLVPGGGIWMCTQRPEWNDANNALAGYGLSMVTASYLHRHVKLLQTLLQDSELGEIRAVVWSWCESLDKVFSADPQDATQDPTARRAVVDALGAAFETYRRCMQTEHTVQPIASESLLELLKNMESWLASTIRSGQREDGTYDGYNLVRFSEGQAEVSRLPLMLEGQVAVLSSGVLNADASATLLEALFDSTLYRADHHTFLLYPFKSIEDFLSKGQVDVQSSALLQQLVEADNRQLVVKDHAGVVRFAPDLVNRRGVLDVLNQLAQDEDWSTLVEQDREHIVNLYESVFDHHAFTGRSGGMYGYEGIGCTYWHMVAKLLVAAGECVQDARHAPEAIQEQLHGLYHRVRDGLGFRRTPHQFGAYPIDAYSHTPGDRGAQQPGMTGQVKEELLTRRMELGIRFFSGEIHFNPSLMLQDEWPTQPRENQLLRRELSAGEVFFQLCGVPVFYTTGSSACIKVCTADGVTEISGTVLPREWSQRVFARDGSVVELHITLSA